MSVTPVKFFPMQGTSPIPWGFVETHREQIEKNHGQSLEVLARRGGLSPFEMFCAINRLNPARTSREREREYGWDVWRAVFSVPQLVSAEKELRDELAALRERINTPITDGFFEGVKNEIEHQRARWQKSDARKTDSDWFWLIGYLAGKALHSPEKRLHHIITTAAALYSWHASTKENT